MPDFPPHVVRHVYEAGSPVMQLQSEYYEQVSLTEVTPGFIQKNWGVDAPSRSEPLGVVQKNWGVDAPSRSEPLDFVQKSWGTDAPSRAESVTISQS